MQNFVAIGTITRFLENDTGIERNNFAKTFLRQTLQQIKYSFCDFIDSKHVKTTATRIKLNFSPQKIRKIGYCCIQ